MLQFFLQAQEPVCGNAVELAEGDDVVEGDFILAVLVPAVNLLGGIQHFGDIHLAEASGDTDHPQIAHNIHKNTPSLRYNAMLHLIRCIDNATSGVYNENTQRSVIDTDAFVLDKEALDSYTIDMKISNWRYYHETQKIIHPASGTVLNS